MNILVCIKQILAPESELAPSIDGIGVAPVGTAERRISRYDACALEVALQLRERSGGRIRVVTVGPPEAAEALRRALGMGADEALHIVAANEVTDPLMVAEALATAAGDGDLILAGVMSEDSMQGTVGPTLAALLGRPCATAAVALELAPDGSGLTVEEELEHGERSIVELTLPAVVTIQSGPWTPRYPSLSGLLKARRQAVQTLDLAAVPTRLPRQRIVGLAPPVPTRQGRMLSGSAGDKAAQLVRLLRQQGFLPPGDP
jgi:electron transfer flavoprotein beta subunit